MHDYKFPEENSVLGFTGNDWKSVKQRRIKN